MRKFILKFFVILLFIFLDYSFSVLKKYRDVFALNICLSLEKCLKKEMRV